MKICVEFDSRLLLDIAREVSLEDQLYQALAEERRIPLKDRRAVTRLGVIRQLLQEAIDARKEGRARPGHMPRTLTPLAQVPKALATQIVGMRAVVTEFEHPREAPKRLASRLRQFGKFSALCYDRKSAAAVKAEDFIKEGL